MKIPARQTKKIALEAIEGGEVEVYTSFTAGDVEEITSSPNKNSLVLPLKLLIKGWNLTNDKNVPLEVNEANIKLLDIKDVNKIVDELNVSVTSFLEKKAEQKKTG